MKRTLLLIFAAFMALSLTGQRPDPFERLVPSKRLDHFQDQRASSDIKKRHASPCLLLQCQLPAPALKSQHGPRMALDSIYDEAFDWLTGQLENDFKSIFFYDETGNQIREVEYIWEDGRWERDWMEEYYFDAAGNPTEGVFSGWDEFDEEWVPVEREVFSFDNAGNLVELITGDWDEFEGEWVPRWKDEFTYDAAGNMITQIYYSYLDQEEEWEEDSKIEFTWDNDNMLSLTSFEWDWVEEEWIRDAMLEFYYETGNPTGWGGFEWDPDQEEWIPEWRGEFTLNAAGNILEELYTEYLQDVEEWGNPYSRVEYQYDEFQNRIQETSYFTDSYPDWEPYQRLEFTVNTDYTTDEILFPMFYGMLFFDWFDYQFPNMLVEIRESVHDGDDWEDWERTAYYYSEIELDEPAVYVLTIDIIGNGTVEVNGEEYSEALALASGTEVTLEAIAGSGYEFVGWTGDLESDEPEITITMDANRQITATFSIVNTSEMLNYQAIKIFPNPFSGSITLENEGMGGTIKITSLSGQTIREYRLDGSSTAVLDTGDLENGIYLLIFTPENGERTVLKMIKN
jgi:uncharacterized repeat protein (TIGR02543 family)